jgi:hypothetical protein
LKWGENFREGAPPPLLFKLPSPDWKASLFPTMVPAGEGIQG